MARKIIDVTLPEWAWLSGGDHEASGDPLDGRNVVLHVRSATVIEFFERDNFVPNGDVPCYEFDYRNAYGLTEKHIAVMHYSAAVEDMEVINDILAAAAEWYCRYMVWEDSNIATNGIAGQN